MDIYKKDNNYLINYEIDNNKLIEYYYGGDITSIPNNIHNQKILDNKLVNQYNIYKDEYYDNIKNSLSINIFTSVVYTFIISLKLFDFDNTTFNNLVVGLSSFFLMITIGCICEKTDRIRRLKLTDYCINNIDIINTKVDKNFSLNTIHEYNNTELNDIKKIIKKEYRNENR